MTHYDDVAKTIAFLVSPAAARITGRIIGVDGNQEWEEKGLSIRPAS